MKERRSEMLVRGYECRSTTISNSASREGCKIVHYIEIPDPSGISWLQHTHAAWANAQELEGPLRAVEQINIVISGGPEFQLMRRVHIMLPSDNGLACILLSRLFSHSLHAGTFSLRKVAYQCALEDDSYDFVTRNCLYIWEVRQIQDH